MDIKTIKTFQMIVELGSFHLAAEKLNYAQSTITMHIKNLEEELDMKLIIRGKNLKLTEAGKLFFNRTQQLLKEFEQLNEEMTSVKKKKTLKIGVMEPFASFRLPVITAEFAKRYPEIQLNIEIQKNEILVNMVEEELLDFAICVVEKAKNNYFFKSIYQEKVLLLVPELHPFALQKEVSLSDLKNEILLTTTMLCPFRNHFEKVAKKIGFLPQYGLEITDMLTLKYFVEANQGMAIIPEVALYPAPFNTKKVMIRDFQESIHVGIYKKQISSLKEESKDFIDIVYAEMNSNKIRI